MAGKLNKSTKHAKKEQNKYSVLVSKIIKTSFRYLIFGASTRLVLFGFEEPT